MKLILLTLLLTGFSMPLWAGTEISARLESTVYKQVWVDLDVLVGDGRVRINFTGPFAKGALLYNKSTSGLILIDGFDKYIVPVTKTDQQAIRWMGMVGGGSIKRSIERSQASVKMAYKLASDNACALLNGEPVLERKNVPMNGFTCELYKTTVNGRTKRDVWLVTPRSATLSQNNYDTLRSLRSLVFDLCGPVLKDFGVDSTAVDKISAAPQLPSLVALYVDGKQSSRLVVRKIRPKVLEDSEFELPAGYRTMGALELIKEGM